MNSKVKNTLIFVGIILVSFLTNFVIRRGTWGRDLCNKTGFPLISTQGGLCINEESLGYSSLSLGYGPLIFNTLFWTLILSLITFLLIKIFKKR
jgi:hypothetical protein